MTYNEAGILPEKGHATAQSIETEMFLEQLEEGRPWLVGEAVHKMTDLINGHRRVDDMAQLRLECGFQRDDIPASPIRTWFLTEVRGPPSHNHRPYGRFPVQPRPLARVWRRCG
jgi:hypothetical protein